MSDFFGSIANFFSDGANWLAKALGIWAPPPPKQRLPSTPKPTGGTPTPTPQAKPVVGSTQKGQADARLNKLPEKDRKRYDTIVASAKSDSERGYLTKALASNHSIDEIEAFSKKIQGKDEKWQQDNLKLTSNSSGKGVKQQWSHSCNATTVQAVQAELDPIYALKLHEENADLTGANDSDGAKMNPKLAAEQKAMLESKYSGGVKGAVGYAGKAADRDKAAKGSGRWADDLLNARSATTGLTYSTKMLDSKTYTIDKATADLDKALAKGQPVPIVIGDGKASATAHYVLVTQMDPGPPKQYTIHDVGAGVTVTRSADDLTKGKINLSGWNQIASIEVPAEATGK